METTTASPLFLGAPPDARRELVGTNRGLALRILRDGIRGADPERALPTAVTRVGHLLHVGRRTYDLRTYRRVVVLGAGKATAGLARGLGALLPDRITGGLVVLRPQDGTCSLGPVDVRHADHPLPSTASVDAGRDLLARARGLGAGDLVLALFTGGSSALVSLPPDDVGADAKRELHALLLASGARIQDVNCVRKAVSQIKGGRLAAAAPRATWVSVTVSDVVGDEPTYVTDLTVPDPDGTHKAVAVLHRLGLWDQVDGAVRRHLLRGEPCADLAGVDQHCVVVASGASAMTAMVASARARGLQPVLVEPAVEGEASLAAVRYAAAVADARSTPSARRVVLLAAGGEVTVTHGPGAGTGGPNQELALAFARHLPAGSATVGAFADSDGIDGGTPHAGALVDGWTVARATRAGADVDDALHRHASTDLLRTTGDLLTLGATGTNVNDLAVVVVDDDERDPR